MSPEIPITDEPAPLNPNDAALLNMMRVFVAEAARIYEARQSEGLEQTLLIDGPRVIYELLAPEMVHLSQEQLRTINVNTKNRMLSTHLIHQGTLRSATIRIAEIFRPAIIENASGLVVVHNHPSGDPEPSPVDVQTTHKIVEAGKLLDVQVLDHVVVARGGFVSLKERGLGF